MSEGIPQLPGLWSLTPWGALLGVLVLNYLLLNWGRLFTKGQHDSIVTPLHATIVKQHETIESLIEQNGALIDGGEVTKEFYERVPVVRGDAPRRRRSGKLGTPPSPSPGDNGPGGGIP